MDIFRAESRIVFASGDISQNKLTLFSLISKIKKILTSGNFKSMKLSKNQNDFGVSYHLLLRFSAKKVSRRAKHCEGLKRKASLSSNAAVLTGEEVLPKKLN